MESFYGGKQGRTYNIVQSYDSVAQMVDCFQKGGEYLDANFGQYVLIDTPNNNNPQNGLLFRRGFSYLEEYKEPPDITSLDYYQRQVENQIYNSETGQYETVTTTTNFFDEDTYKQAFRNWLKKGVGGGAIYIGQIVGPEGHVPEIDLIPWNNTTDSETFTDYFLHYYETQSLNAQTDLQSPVSTIPTIEEQTNETYNESDGTTTITTSYVWHDGVEAGRVNIRDTDGNIIGAKIAFNFPTPVVKVSSQSVEPYDSTSVSFTDSYTSETDTYQIKKEQSGDFSNLVHLHNSSGPGKHPYYYNYNVAIPKGVKGDSIQSIYLNTERDKLYFNILNYDNNKNGTAVTPVPYIDYKEVKEITLEPVQVVIDEEHDVTATSFNQINVTYTTGEPQTLNLVNTIIDVKRRGDGIYVLYSDATKRPSGTGEDNRKFWITDYTAPDGTVYPQLVYAFLEDIQGGIHADGIYTPEDIQFDTGILAKGFDQINNTQELPYTDYYKDRAGWFVVIRTQKPIYTAGEEGQEGSWSTQEINDLYMFDYNAYLRDPENPPYTITFWNQQQQLIQQDTQLQYLTYNTFWYKISGIENVSIHPQNLFAFDNYQSDTPYGQLREGGIWFVQYPAHVH